MNRLIKTTALLAFMALTACSKNPLDKQSPHDAARLLTDASLVAMKDLGFKEPQMSERYARCMEHKTAALFDCDRLYQAMTEVLTKKGVPLRIADVVDKKMYERVKDELKLISYYSL